MSRISASGSAPLVSVVLPVYNAAKHVEQAVRSILEQTCRHFELIIINDGSCDGSLEILQRLRNADERIVLVSRENRGLVRTLNEGIAMARGDWIARMDADDIALPQRFERQLAWLEASGADLCGSWFKRFGGAEPGVIRVRQDDEAIKMEMLFASPFAHPAVMMRAALIKTLRYDPQWEKAEDYDLWVRAAQAGWTMSNVPEILLLYRVHSDQISSSAAERQRALARQIRLRYWRHYFGLRGWEPSCIDEIFKIDDAESPPVDMVVVDGVLDELLASATSDQVRAVVFEHALRLYVRAAASQPGLVSRWLALQRKWGRPVGVLEVLAVGMVGVLKLKVDGAGFARLRRAYVFMRHLRGRWLRR